MAFKNKKVILFFLLVIITLIPIIYDIYYLYFTVYGDYLRIYDLKVPKPKNIISVFYEIVAFGEGETYTILVYDDERFNKVKKLDIWREINEDKYIKLKEKINDFQSLALEWDFESDPFVKHPINLDKNSLYYLNSKGDGSWMLAILNTKERKIYVMEESW